MIQPLYGRLSSLARGNNWRRFAVRGLVSIAVLAALFVWLPADALLGAMARIPLPVWLLVIVGFLAGHLLSALKWRLVLHAVGVGIARGEAIRAHGAGLFANLCLPSVVGGDVVRAGMVMRNHRRIEHVALGSLGDRLNDTLALVLIAATAALLLPGVAGTGSGRVLGLVAAILFGGAITVYALVRWTPLDRVPGKLSGVLLRLREAVDALQSAPGIMLLAFMLSVAIQSGFVLLNILLASRIGIEADAILWFFAWPLAKLIALAPVSLGGIGVREVAIAGLMTPFGLDTAQVVGQSLSWEVVLVVSGLLSGLLVAWFPAGSGGAANR